MIATHAIYRTADGAICAPTHPDVAYLVCGAGAEVPGEYADQLGVIEEADDVETEPEASAEAVGDPVDEAAVEVDVEAESAAPAQAPKRTRKPKS